MSELWQRGAGELAALIAAREVSSREVVEAHLARIEAVNPHLNALTRVLADEARAGADAADRAVASGAPLGRLHGVPCTVKQNIDMVGCSTNHGVTAFAEAMPTVDAPVVERVRAAGAVPIGRGNCPDMALRVHTDSSLFGLTRNPWDATRTTGGSSGGEASALAAGMAPDRPRQRHRRFAPQPGVVLRGRIAQAVGRAGPGVRVDPGRGGAGVVPADAGAGPDGPPGGRCAAGTRGARRPPPP
jgi:hypothetical protein